MTTRAAVLAAACVLGAIVLVAVRRPSMPAGDQAHASLSAEPAAYAEGVETDTQPVQVAEAVPPRAPTGVRVSEPLAAEAVKPAPKAVPVATVTPAAHAVVVEREERTEPEVRNVDPAASPNAPAAALVTITGCVERNDDVFRLTDTSGIDAPTSRSWKSGFFRKRPAKIALVDPLPGIVLPAHVGMRVAVSGTLAERELSVQSLQRVGVCD